MIGDALPHRWRLAFESSMFATKVVEGLIHRTLIVHILDSLSERISLAHQIAVARARRPVLSFKQRCRDSLEFRSLRPQHQPLLHFHYSPAFTLLDHLPVDQRRVGDDLRLWWSPALATQQRPL